MGLYKKKMNFSDTQNLKFKILMYESHILHNLTVLFCIKNFRFLSINNNLVKHYSNEAKKNAPFDIISAFRCNSAFMYYLLL